MGAENTVSFKYIETAFVASSRATSLMTDNQDKTGEEKSSFLPPIAGADKEKDEIKEEKTQLVPDKAANAAPVEAPKANAVSPDLDQPSGKASATPKAQAPAGKDAATVAAKAKRTKEDRSKSFKFIRGYAYRECCSISLGMLFLIGGSLSDLIVPLFIGWVVNDLKEEDYDAIGTKCLYMLIIIVVSTHFWCVNIKSFGNFDFCGSH